MKNKKGFTLIELMIVIAIIAILAAILVPNFLRARAQGQYTQCQANCKNIGTALEMYSTDNSGNYPKSSDFGTKLTSDYLRQIPTCASAGTDTYSAGYTSSITPDAYTFYCEGATNHKAVGVEANYPQYTSAAGLIPKKP